MTMDNVKLAPSHRRLTWLVIIVLPLAATVACRGARGPDRNGTSQTLSGTQWTLDSIGAKPRIAESNVTLLFDSAQPGNAGGFGGCNSYGGKYEQNGPSLTFADVASTLRACVAEGITEQETEYHLALRSARRFEIKAERLYLVDSAGTRLLVFSKKNG
jgi:putative lipoprotein